MEAKAIVKYVVCDDTIKDFGIQEDPQSKMTMAEVMTTAIISSIQFFGNFEKARIALKNERYIPNMLSKSQFNRRLHRIGKNVWYAVLKRLYSILSSKDTQNQFIVDSFPLPACKFVRRYKSRLFKEKKYIGYCTAKDEFFLGFNLKTILFNLNKFICCQFAKRILSEKKAIENYRQEYDQKRRIYKTSPLHDWSSHFADCLRYLCVSLPKTRDSLSPEELDKRYYEALYGEQANMPSIFRDDVPNY